MKILILTNKLPYPPRDGGAIASLNMAMGFTKCENEVHLLAINTSKHYFPLDSLPPELTKSIKFYDVYINTKLSVIRAILNFFFSRKPYNAVRFINRRFKAKINELLNDNAYDLIQLEGLYLSPYLETIRKHSKALISMRSHNIEHKIWQKSASLETNYFKKKYLKSLASRIRRMEFNSLNKFDTFIPITKPDAEKFIKFGCSVPLFVSRATVNLENYKTQTNQNNKLTLFHIGALDWLPNLDGLQWFFKNVWPKVRKKYPELEFYIAGRNASDNFINSINLEGVNFMGEVDDALFFMQKHSIMIVPLFSGSGMRVKIIEGMALGKAIISTKLGAEGIDATDNKEILLANNEKQFIEKIFHLLEDYDLFLKLSDRANIFAQENFDTFAQTKKLVAFYNTQL